MPDNGPGNDDLRTWLRRGDPGANDLTIEEARSMRRRILATPPEAPRFRPTKIAALVAATALAAVLLLRPSPVTVKRPTPVRSFAAATQDRAARQIQFTTDGGTRIVWTLDPDFEL